MLLRYCEQVFGSQDLPYSVCLHPPSEDGDQRNWHAHVVFSYRPMVRADEADWQIGRALRSDLDCPEQWTRMRFLLAEELNYTCEMHGVNKCYTHLSYAAAGNGNDSENCIALLPNIFRHGCEAGVQGATQFSHALQCRVARHRRMVLLVHRDLLTAPDLGGQPGAKMDLRNVIHSRPGSVQSATSIDIRGVKLPSTPELLSKDGDIREHMIPANDTGAVSECGSTSPAEVIPPKLPNPLPEGNGEIDTAFDLERFSPVELPEPPSSPATEPEIAAYPAPVMPQPLDTDAAVEPVGMLPSKAPTVPAALAAGGEKDILAEVQLSKTGIAAPAIPEPVEYHDQLFADRWQLLPFVTPKLPEPVETASDGSVGRAIHRSLDSDRSPQLSHPLPSEAQTPSEFYRISTFDGCAPRIVEPLDIRFASDLDDIETVAPRLPEGVLNDPAQEKAAEDFNTLNSSDLVGKSVPKAPVAHSQVPSPPEQSLGETEPSSRVGKQWQNGQEEEPGRSPAETDPGLDRTQLQVAMLRLMRLLEQQRSLLGEDEDDRITVPTDILRRAGARTDQVTADHMQRRLTALHARNKAEFDAIASHVAAFPGQLTNGEGYWSLDQDAPPAVRTAVKAWRNDEKVQQALARVAGMALDRNGSAAATQRRDAFLAIAMGMPVSSTRGEREMSPQIDPRQSGEGVGD